MKISNIRLLTLLVCILCVSMIQFAVTNSQAADQIDYSKYTEHPYLEITSDDQLLTIASSEGWVGSGEPDDPIIIENYHFTGKVAENQHIRDLKQTETYFPDDFKVFSLVILNLKISVTIRNNLFSHGLLVQGLYAAPEDSSLAPKNEIGILHNRWVTANDPNNLMTFGHKFTISQNVFFGSNPNCDGEDGVFSSRLVFKGRISTIEKNRFTADTGCHPIQHIYFMGSPPTQLGYTDASIDNNIFETSFISMYLQLTADIHHNDFYFTGIAILGTFTDIHDNNFYTKNEKMDYTTPFFSKPLVLAGYYDPAQSETIKTLSFKNRLHSNYYDFIEIKDKNDDGYVDTPYITGHTSKIYDLTPLTKPVSTYFNPIEEDRGLRQQEIILIITLISLPLAYVGYFHVYPYYNRRSMKSSYDVLGNSASIIKELFQSQTILYYTLIGQNKALDNELETKLNDSIPKKIYDFKFIFHPIRISILKLLYENLELNSVELKNIMDISWNDYTTHSTSLLKRGYIKIENGFIDGHKRQILTITSKGVEEFKQFLDLMQLFMDNTTDLNAYIASAQKRLEVADPDLYPNE